MELGGTGTGGPGSWLVLLASSAAAWKFLTTLVSKKWPKPPAVTRAELEALNRRLTELEHRPAALFINGEKEEIVEHVQRLISRVQRLSVQRGEDEDDRQEIRKLVDRLRQRLGETASG